MLLNRDEFVLALFRETDRAQRMKTPLSLIYCGIDEAGSRSSQLDPGTFGSAVDEIVRRIAQTLRSYDTMTRMGQREFAMLLPGCTSSNATALAQRLNQEQFAAPVMVAGSPVQLTSYFGVTTSWGRSALVVLNEAEQAFRKAKADGAAIHRTTTAENTYLGAFLMSMSDEPSPS